MSWGKLCDGFYSHTKTHGCSLAAVGVFCASVSWSAHHETDGEIPEHMGVMLARGDLSLCDELVRVNFWDRTEVGYRIHDFLVYNPSSDDLEERRAANREAARSARLRHLTRQQPRHQDVMHDVVTPPADVTRDVVTPGTGSYNSNKVAKRGAGQGRAGFDEFWAAYPRKVGRKKAEDEWRKLAPTSDVTAVILAAVEAQKGWVTWQREGGRFIPNPATWIHQGRWLDEAPAKVVPLMSEQGQHTLDAAQEWLKMKKRDDG